MNFDDADPAAKARIIDSLGFDPWVCRECDNEILGPCITDDWDAGGECWCSSDCLDEHQSREAEAAYERSLEDYYGGGGPLTMREQQMADYLEKRSRG